MIATYNSFLVEKTKNIDTNTIKGSLVGYILTINDKKYNTINCFRNMKFNPIIIDCMIKNNKIYNLNNILLSHDNYIQ